MSKPLRRPRSHPFLVLVALGILATTASAGDEIPTCFECTFGLYDEPELIHQFGDIVPFVMKDVYFGVKYASNETSLTGVEFSITGLYEGASVLVGSIQALPPIPFGEIFGSVAAPADTSQTSTGHGGANAAWQSCIVGSQALLRIRLLALEPVTNYVLRVMHRFPTTNPNYLFSPVFTRCNSPMFTAVRVTGLEYTLNGVVSAEGKSWSGLKQLYQ